jgi:hypothetical protein
MDDKEVKNRKFSQISELGTRIAKCVEVDAKGHGVFIYMHEDEQLLTILTFNAGPDIVCNLVHSANVYVKDAIKKATSDAPPREKYN